jgi:hypothetical protein
MSRVVAVLATGLLLCGAAGCGSKSKSNTSSQGANANGAATQPATTGAAGSQLRFAKTKFVLHAGLGFGAFHRYIYKPFKARKLGGGLFKNKAAKIKAAVAAAFAYHELRLALNAARGSKILSKALAPLLALQTKLGSMRTSLKRGDTSQVPSANSALDSASSASKAAGAPIQDQPTPALGG